MDDAMFTSEPLEDDPSTDVIHTETAEIYVKEVRTGKDMSETELVEARTHAAKMAKALIDKAVKEGREFIVVVPSKGDAGNIEMVGAFSPLLGTLSLIEAARAIGPIAEKTIPGFLSSLMATPSSDDTD